MRCFALLLCAAIAAPASAEIVTLRFQGSIPEFNSFFGSGTDFDFTTPQRQFISSMYRAQGSTPGAPYDFTLSYDTNAAAGANGRYAMTLVSGMAASATDFTGWNPSLYFQEAGAFTYLVFALERVQQVGPFGYTSGIFLALGDNDGSLQAGTLPAVVDAAQLDAITASFEVRGTRGAFRTITDQQSRNVTQILSGGAPVVPEPAAWAMMIGGLGLVGAALRRRAPASVSYA
jgi:hypothetical protein